MVNASNPIIVGLYGGGNLYRPSAITNNSGTYLVRAYGPGIMNLSPYYDFSGLNNTVVNCPTCLSMDDYQAYISVPGERYLNSGTCSNPATVMTYPITLTSGQAGTTVTGPSITLDDSCSFEGLYGLLTYTGSRGTVGTCRRIFLKTYSDAAYTIPLSPNASTLTNGGNYMIITNVGSGSTGLSPFYAQAFFDANGDNIFDAGDPYVNLGQVTPSSDGLQLNISFGDTNIK